MKYKHSIVVAYKFNHNETLVLHINIIDENPNQYNIADLTNMYLCNEIPGQEIWGTLYDHGHFIYPVFYCKKPLGETSMLLKLQSATTGQEYWEENCWNINDAIEHYTSNIIQL